MGILSGIVSYLFGLTINLLDAAVDGFLGALGFDLDTFETFFPAAKDYYEVIAGFGIGLLFIMLIFQIFRNFGVMLDIEAEDPLKILGKTALFYGMIISSRSITNFILNLLADPYAIFLGAASDPYEFKLMTLVTAMFDSVFSNPFMSIVAIILMLILGWQFLKLTIECVERYIVFYFVLYTAPVVFATGAFKSTSQIFKSWCRMLGSQALLLLLNIWSIKLFMSYLPVLESDADQLVFNFLIGYAFLKFAQKADTLLRILGLNTASTGDMVRSLGGTIASIAFAVKSFSGMAGTAASAIGKILGGAGSAGAATIAGTARSTAGSAVSGMAGLAGAAGAAAGVAASGIADAVGGVAGSGMSAAKQGYINDVLGSANSQMRQPGIPDSVKGQKPVTPLDYRSMSLGGGSSGEERSSTDYFDGLNRDSSSGRFDGSGTEEGGTVSDFGGDRGGGFGGRRGNSDMQPDGTRSGSPGNPRVDAETREGLANLAHGIPHDSYDPVKKTYSGGGFPEFRGENANMIGASQLTPADGFEQHGVKMRDGSVGTLYQNSETGEAHLVQFGSVDNGVIQGAISEVDKDTGQFGDFMAFKAVHGSVPGAESFSDHSVPVSDSEGGVYHVSTGAATSFFAPGAASAMSGAADYSTPAQGAVPPANAPYAAPGVSAPVPSGGVGAESISYVGVSAHDTSTIHTSSIGTPGATPSVSGTTAIPPPVGNVINDSAPPVSGSPDVNSAQPIDGVSGISSVTHETASGSSVVHESVNIPAPGAGSPPVDTKMGQSPEEARRFSRNNPANMEIFRREAGGVESFDRAAANPDTIPQMDSSNK